jgi:hypothetical protein
MMTNAERQLAEACRAYVEWVDRPLSATFASDVGEQRRRFDTMKQALANCPWDGADEARRAAIEAMVLGREADGGRFTPHAIRSDDR